MTEPRGIRNRNPGNLRYVASIKWEGLDSPPTDGSFCRFRSDQFGIRALVKQLRTYRDRYGLHSIADLIARYAPSSENDTRAYQKAVAAAFNRTPAYTPDLDDPAQMETLVRAIVRHENGPGPFDGEWYTDIVYQAGIKLAMPMSKSRTMIGGATAGAATAAQGLLDVVQESTQQAAVVADTVGIAWPEIARWVLLAVALAGIGYALYARFQAREDGIR
jgi:hypothetical protein